jgi:epsin
MKMGKTKAPTSVKKAKDITNLLTDDTRLRQERKSRANMRDRMLGSGSGFGGGGEDEDENSRRRENNKNGKRAKGRAVVMMRN